MPSYNRLVSLRGSCNGRHGAQHNGHVAQAHCVTSVTVMRSRSGAGAGVVTSATIFSDRAGAAQLAATTTINNRDTHHSGSAGLSAADDSRKSDRIVSAVTSSAIRRAAQAASVEPTTSDVLPRRLGRIDLQRRPTRHVGVAEQGHQRIDTARPVRRARCPRAADVDLIGMARNDGLTKPCP